MPAGHPIDLRPQLRDLIKISREKGDTTLPSALELARRWGFIPRTVNRAVTRLMAEGLLIRRGKKLHILQSPTRHPTPQEPPFIIHNIIDQYPKWLHSLYESRNCIPVFHVWTDVTQCWGLLSKTLKTSCEGVILAAGLDIIPPPSTLRLIEELTERRIPLVLNQPMGRSNQVVSEVADHPAAIRQLVEAGHRRVLVPYVSDHYLWSVPKLSGNSGIPSIFESFGIQVLWEPLGPAPAKSRLREVLTRHRSGRNGVTALYCFETEIAVRLCETARELGIQIPAHLSIILTQETSGSTPGSQPVSTWWLNVRNGPRLAIDLLVNQIREIRATGHMPGPEIIRAEPFFIDRGTFGPARRHKAAPARDPVTIWQNRWPSDPALRRQQVARINTTAYPVASKSRADEWLPLELDGIFNRQFGREHGWVGNLPLLHMPRGRQIIHGVPFQIAGNYLSEKPDCVVMRSLRAHTGQGNILPSETVLQIKQKPKAVYFLHSCGWASKQQRFASYKFHYADRTVVEVPLEPFKSGASSGIGGRRRALGNIQDWWPSLNAPQLESAHVRHYVITDGGDPLFYERYLYTLEWINPRPDKTIVNLVIRSDPEAETTLGVLAITIRK